MTNRKDGGPAFPYKGKSVTRDTTSGTIVNEKEVYYPGISTRDWFAGMALQSLNNQTFYYDEDNMNTYPVRSCSDKAIYSYKIADAMLAEREKAGSDE